MNDIAIRVENLSKRYRIGVERHDTLRDALAGFGRKNPQSAIQNPKSEEFWALRDVSFEVKRGEVVGVIGRNGAGKSTLLKILSRITEPTGGTAEIHGRVGSLLEVGTGFHPELTGRENIYLNGAILGMKRTEIARRFDEIVAFSEIEKFLDTPVKRYSSGMYVRLAFAVAAHLEPEILLVDEVLAVGDAAFQKKCLGKMGEVAGEGRTVLFVSHNMGAVASLCDRSICLLEGNILCQGETSSTISYYLDSTSNAYGPISLSERKDRIGNGKAHFTKVRFLDGRGKEVQEIYMGDPLTIEVSYDVHDSIMRPIFGFMLADQLGRTVLRAYSRESCPDLAIVLADSGIVRCSFQSLPLMHARQYTLNLWLGSHRNDVVDYVESAADLTILQKDVYATGILPDSYNGGICFAQHKWTINVT